MKYIRLQINVVFDLNWQEVWSQEPFLNTHSLFASSNSALEITEVLAYQNKYTTKTTQQTPKPYPQSLARCEIPSQCAKLFTDLDQYPALFRLFLPQMPHCQRVLPHSVRFPSLPSFPAHIISVHVFPIIMLLRYPLPDSVAKITMVYYYVIVGSQVR